MQRLACAVLFVSSLLVLGPASTALAGGPEFPADGVRSIGRGGAAFLRADDPSVMLRNPALLGELWDNMASLGAHFLLVDACFQPIGYYGANAVGNAPAAVQFGDGVEQVVQLPEGSQRTDGTPLVGFGSEPYDQVCYEGPAPFLPTLALTMKLTDDLGVGIGFFPPDTASLTQWGNRDGSLDTPRGRRPNPTRFFRSHQDTSFFSMMGSVGYRIADWISVGAGFQWTLVVFNVTAWSTEQANPTPFQSNIKSEVFGRDLFIPAFVASVTLHPLDSLDVGVGFKWADGIRTKAKFDFTPGAFGTGEPFDYLRPLPNGEFETVTIGSTIPTTTHNQPGTTDSPPIWAPQLSLGVRYADRLKPKVKSADLAAAKVAAGPKVEDSMEVERWDIELDAIYYFNSVNDESVSRFPNSARLFGKAVFPDGRVADVAFAAGQCSKRDAMNNCIGVRESKTAFNGQDQITLRLGGDYNIMPGFLALRAGVSYETNGQATDKICLETGLPPAPGTQCAATGEADYLNLIFYMQGRTGLHAGVTLRVADKTDISFGFAHFIQRKVHLQLNRQTAATYNTVYKTLDYHFQPGQGVEAAPIEYVPAELQPPPGDFDGVAGVEVPNGDSVRTDPGPNYINAGSYYYHLDVVSVNFTQHF